MSGDFTKANSCLDRYIELVGLKETGLETTLGLRSVKLAESEEVKLVRQRSDAQSAKKLSILLLRIGNFARFHKDPAKSRHYATRAFNVSRAFGLHCIVALSACLVGLADADAHPPVAPSNLPPEVEELQ